MLLGLTKGNGVHRNTYKAIEKLVLNMLGVDSMNYLRRCVTFEKNQAYLGDCDEIYNTILDLAKVGIN